MPQSQQRLHRFMDLDFVVPPHVLRPRPETELLGARALTLLSELEAQSTVIDMCCGCGNLGVALAVHMPSCRVWASDVSEAAMSAAQANVERHDVSSRVTIRRGDLFEALAEHGLQRQVDMVVCNPPYISTGKLEGSSANLLEAEPREAFDGGPFGLSVHQRLIREALAYLKHDGALLCEFGEGQARQIEALFKRAKGYGPVEFVIDASGMERVAIARSLHPASARKDV